MPSNNTAILGATWSSSPAEYPSIRIRDGQYPAVSRSILQYHAVSQYPGSALERCIALRPQSHVQQRDARQQIGEASRPRTLSAARWSRPHAINVVMQRQPWQLKLGAGTQEHQRLQRLNGVCKLLHLRRPGVAAPLASCDPGRVKVIERSKVRASCRRSSFNVSSRQP